MQSFDVFVSALETRFDFHSARILAKDAAAPAGLTDRSDWTDDELRLAVASVPSVGRDMQPVLERLGLTPVEVGAASPTTPELAASE